MVCRSGKTVSIIYSECVSVPLVIQHVKFMRGIMLLSVTSLALPYFSTLSLKRQDYRIFFFIFSTKFPEKFFVLRRIQRDVITTVLMYSCKVLVILVGC